jgi:hypothetical protein
VAKGEETKGSRMRDGGEEMEMEMEMESLVGR